MSQPFAFLRPAAAPSPSASRLNLPPRLARAGTLACGLGLGLALGALAVLPAPARAAVTLNLKDADLSTLVQTVSEVTGKNFIIDPRVKAKVTVVSSRPMSAAQLYQTFLSVLEINGFATVPAGGAIKIIPDTNAKTESTSLLGNGRGLPADEIVTHVYALQNVSATQLVPIVRPLMPQWAHIAAYTGNNTLVIADRAGNVQRIGRIIAQLDKTGDRDIQIVRLANAPAAEVTRIVSTLIQQDKGADPGARAASIIADERTNSVLISGDPLDRARVLALVKRLDMGNPAPQDPNGNTQVVYLRYASAENLAPILEGYAQTVQESLRNSGGFAGVPGTPGSAAQSASNATVGSTTTVTTSYTPGSGTGVFDRARIIADKETNALIITAPPRVMVQIRNVVTQLDIERAQVLVEAIIAEVSASQSVQLGVDFAAFNQNAIATADILNPNTASAISGVGTVAASGTGSATTALLGLLSLGGTAAFGRLSSSGTSFAAILKALQSDGSTNVLSFPSLLTLDNQEAKFSAGQEVPFQTGSYTNGLTSVGGTVNPFQTTERKDVGLKIGVTPQINEGNRVKLKFTLEVSSIASGSAGTSNLITNKRTIANVVSVQDGQVLVISGLVDDNLRESDNRIPVLGDIPYLGRLFQYRSSSKDKRNLMIFLHPVILRGREGSDYYTKAKYDGLRSSQVQSQVSPDGIVPLIGGRYPVLAPLEDYLANSNRPGLAGTTASGPVIVGVPSASGRLQQGEALPSPIAALPQESVVLPNSAAPRPDPLVLTPSGAPNLPPSSRERIGSRSAATRAPVLADPSGQAINRESSPAAVTYIAPRAERLAPTQPRLPPPTLPPSSAPATTSTTTPEPATYPARQSRHSTTTSGDFSR